MEELEPRPLQCFRCLEKGHVQAKYNGGANCAACCYKRGEEGHLARDCRAPVRCSIYASLGRPDKHRVGSRACTAPKRRAKSPTTQPTQRATAPPSTQEGESSSQGMAPPMEEVEMREESEDSPSPTKEGEGARTPRLPPEDRWREQSNGG